MNDSDQDLGSRPPQGKLAWLRREVEKLEIEMARLETRVQEMEHHHSHECSLFAQSISGSSFR